MKSPLKSLIVPVLVPFTRMLAPIIGLPELSTTVPLKTVSGSSALMAGADFAVAFTLTPANAEQNNAANNKFPSPKDLRFISNVLKVIKLFFKY